MEEGKRKTTRKKASEAEKRVETPAEPRITFQEYQEKTPVNRGLVASFTYEASIRGVDIEGDTRTEKEWLEALDEQSKRQY